MTSLPKPFLERMQRLLGDDFPAFLAGYEQPARVGLRLNPLKISPADFTNLSPFSLSPIPFSPSGFTLQNPAESSPGKHPYHAAGLYYLQEPSAMAVAELLAPQPGDLVLDLAAAPGGKSTHLAGLLHGQGALVANEIHPRRVWELAENLERWGSPNVAILNETPSRLAQALEGVFDKVLLDAPCSGEGMFRKSESARMDWSLQHIESCALRQSAILDEAARLVRPGGRLAYSTCTFAPEENEAVIARFLQAHPQFSLEKTPLLPGASPGRPEWVQAELPSLEQTLRFWPHHGAGEGHFIALLRRAGDASPRRQPIHKSGNTASGEARRLFRRFSQESLELEFDESCLSQRGSYLYWIHSRLPAMGSLKTIHPGLWLGVIKTGRFEPAHALAMALSRGQAKRQASLQPDEVRAYLRGEVLSDAGDDGWTLVTVDGFSLGWAKRVRGMLKNYYPKGLRHP